ncbi:MAG: tRNA-intron lyase [Candidatus Bathyarchaeia archaeon]
MADYTAELVNDHLVVWDPAEGEKLYRLGFFGKPLGVAKPRLGDFSRPLLLDLIEGLYLFDKGVIRVCDARGRPMRRSRLLARGREVYERFNEEFLVYKDLRDLGKVVLPGIKFGCEFAVYERGPGIDHAPYLVSVRRAGDLVSSADLVRAGRLATTVRKRFVVAVPDVKASLVRYLMFDWFKA